MFKIKSQLEFARHIDCYMKFITSRVRELINSAYLKQDLHIKDQPLLESDDSKIILVNIEHCIITIPVFPFMVKTKAYLEDKPILPIKEMIHPNINAEEHIKALEDAGYDTSFLIKKYKTGPTSPRLRNLLKNTKYYLNKIPIIFDYSRPNMHTIQENLNLFFPTTNTIPKILYAPALMYPYILPVNITKNLDVITCCSRIYEQSFDLHESRHRRYYLCKRLEQKLGSSYKNFMGIEDLLPIYLDSKILINVHQTNNHLTIEEQRILPALMCGMVVISEDGPFRETIPYQEYIIWCSYEELEDKAQEVLDNYDYYFNKIHGPESKLKDVLYKMEIQMEVDLKNALIEQDLLELDLAAEEVFFEDLYKKTNML